MAGPELAQQYRYIASAWLLHYAQSPHGAHTQQQCCARSTASVRSAHSIISLEPQTPSTLALGQLSGRTSCGILGGSDPSCACSHQIVETEHLMKALLEQPNGLARRIVAKAGSNPSMLLERTEEFIRQQPKVSGSSDQVQLVMGP